MEGAQAMDADSTSPNRFGISLGLKSERFRAQELGVHPITLRRARVAGDLGFVTIGTRVFYSDRHITAWLARHERAVRQAEAA